MFSYVYTYTFSNNFAYAKTNSFTNTCRDSCTNIQGLPKDQVPASGRGKGRGGREEGGVPNPMAVV